jgi:hypothetical protein
MNAPLSQRPPRKFRGRAPSLTKTLEDLIVAGDAAGVAAWLDRDPGAATKTLRGGTPPLLLAVALKQEDIVELLVMRGADLLAEDTRQRTAVHVAAEKCHAGVMSLLLRAMRRKNPRHALMVLSRPQANGCKPVMSASKDGRTLQTIVDTVNSFAESVGKSREESMEAIGINECYAGTGLWPMHVAAAHGNVEAVEALIASGADLSPLARTPNSGSAGSEGSAGSAGMTPLMLACQEGYIEAARAILSASLTASSSVVGTVTENGGVSALHLASMMGHADVCDLLVECGADPRRRDANGKRPADYLVALEHPIKEAGSKTSPKSDHAITSQSSAEDASAEVKHLIAGAMECVSGGGQFGTRMGTLSAPILDMQVNVVARNAPISQGSSPILERGRASSGGGNTGSEVGLQTSYLGEPFGNPTLAYLIPHVEKALVSLSKKYESAAVREFERNNNGIYSTKSKSSSLVTSDDDHHPKDAFATYMLRHKHDRMLPQISALKKL